MDLPERLVDDLHDAFPVLVDEYEGAVFSLALRLCGPDEAEDVAQETFVRAYGALGRYDAGRILALSLRPWVITIALNVVRNRARHAARHPQVALEDGMGVGRVSDGLDASDLRAALAAGLLRLPFATRQAVVLRHVLGFDTAETASMLDRPEGTVKAQVSRGLATLRRELALAGITSEDRT